MDFLFNIDRHIARAIARVAKMLGLGPQSLFVTTATLFIPAFIVTCWKFSGKLDWLLLVTIGFMAGSALFYTLYIFRRSPEEVAARLKKEGGEWLSALRPFTLVLAIPAIFCNKEFPALVKILFGLMFLWDYARSLYLVDTLDRRNTSHPQ